MGVGLFSRQGPSALALPPAYTSTQHKPNIPEFEGLDMILVITPLRTVHGKNDSMRNYLRYGYFNFRVE